MKKFNNCSKGLVYLGIVMLSFVFASCSNSPVSDNDNEEGTPPEEFVNITSQNIDQREYTVYALDSLKTGHNEIYIAVENGQEEEVVIKDPMISPLMYMKNKTHGAPVSEVDRVQKKGQTYFKADVYFTMASMDSEYWMLKIEGKTEGGTAVEEELRVDVAGGGMQVKKKVNDRMYILSYVVPKVPLTGGDDYEVALHYMKNMMRFPAVQGATVKVDPFMDMGGGEGHGPTSFDEVATEENPGRYSGSINYNMSGEWQLTFTATLKDGTQIPFSTLEIMVEQ